MRSLRGRVGWGLMLAVAGVGACGGRRVDLNAYDAGKNADAEPQGTLTDAAVAALFDATGSGICPGQDAGSGIVTLWSNASAVPGDIAIDDTNVYWLEQSSVGALVKIRSVSKCGGAAATLAAVSAADALATDGTNVYWTEAQAVMSVPKLGGTPVMVGYGSSTIPALTTGGPTVYWFEVESRSTLTLESPTGGNAVTLTDGQPLPGGLVIATDGTTVYWISSDNGTELAYLWAVSVGGGTPARLVSETSANGLGFARSLAVDESYVYWRDTTDRLWVVSKSGGAAKLMATSIQDGGVSPGRNYQGLAVDESSVYWSVGTVPATYDFYGDQFGGSILQVPKAGGTVVTVATDPLAHMQSGFALDGSYVYWLSGVRTDGGTPSGCELHKARHGSGTGTP